jgi:hypothetical protein
MKIGTQHGKPPRQKPKRYVNNRMPAWLHRSAWSANQARLAHWQPPQPRAAAHVIEQMTRIACGRSTMCECRPDKIFITNAQPKPKWSLEGVGKIDKVI